MLCTVSDSLMKYSSTIPPSTRYDQTWTVLFSGTWGENSSIGPQMASPVLKNGCFRKGSPNDSRISSRVAPTWKSLGLGGLEQASPRKMATANRTRLRRKRRVCNW